MRLFFFRKLSDELTLTKREELLLMRWFDGERGRLSNWLVRRVLAKQKAAQEYIRQLELCRASVKQAQDSFVNEESNSSIWDSVLARINREEQASLYLGPRITHINSCPHDEEGSWYSVWGERFGWGVCGALGVTVIAVVWQGLPLQRSSAKDNLELSFDKQLVISDKEFEPNNKNDLISSGSHLVSFGSQNPAGQVASESAPFESVPFESVLSYRASKYNNNTNEPLGGRIEVDWIRSDGTLRLIEGSESQSTLIWAKRDKYPNSSLKLESSPSPSPSTSTSTSTSTDQSFTLSTSPVK
jgi:hypothetical protein